MLSGYQQNIVWQGMLGAETRSQYFAALGYRYQRQGRMLLWGSLFFSSGAFVTVLPMVLPADAVWPKVVTTLIALTISLFSVVSDSQSRSTDCQDLHSRWQLLANEYQALWANVYVQDAVDRLAAIQKTEADLSKSSTRMPDRPHLMEKCQDNVVLMHQYEMAA
jgi:hypothetical protein